MAKREPPNIRKCVNVKFDRIIICAYGARLLKKIQSIALSDLELEKELSSGRIEIKPLQTFLDGY